VCLQKLPSVVPTLAYRRSHFPHFPSLLEIPINFPAESIFLLSWIKCRQLSLSTTGLRDSDLCPLPESPIHSLRPSDENTLRTRKASLSVASPPGLVFNQQERLSQIGVSNHGLLGFFPVISSLEDSLLRDISIPPDLSLPLMLRIDPA